jgi:hypothetical protein
LPTIFGNVRRVKDVSVGANQARALPTRTAV